MEFTKNNDPQSRRFYSTGLFGTPREACGTWRDSRDLAFLHAEVQDSGNTEEEAPQSPETEAAFQLAANGALGCLAKCARPR